MESELLQEMKIMNGVLDKEPRTLTGEIFVEAGGFRYNTNLGCMHGNTIETMILVSVGSKFPVGKVVHPRIRNPALAAKAKQIYGSLPFIVPGLHEEAAADLMATATPELKAPNSTVVKLYLDVPMMQRSKHYILPQQDTRVSSALQKPSWYGCIIMCATIHVYKMTVLVLMCAFIYTTHI